MAYSASAVSNTAIAFQKPITLQQGRALRDNPLEMFLGGAGAPRLQFEAMDTWYSTAGAVGSYAFAKGSADTAFGSTVAGSTLTPTSAVTDNSTSSGVMSASFTVGAALSGTWRCMGTYDASQAATGGGAYLGATLWIRIA